MSGSNSNGNNNNNNNTGLTWYILGGEDRRDLPYKLKIVVAGGGHGERTGYVTSFNTVEEKTTFKSKFDELSDTMRDAVSPLINDSRTEEEATNERSEFKNFLQRSWIPMFWDFVDTYGLEMVPGNVRWVCNAVVFPLVESPSVPFPPLTVADLAFETNAASA